ncbi:MAG: SPASM domain-containing protein [Deltaproteobacteria bacterium]|nr:SPASM domain-containing protein [Deltaproteobacteria bacterium]
MKLKPSLLNVLVSTDPRGPVVYNTGSAGALLVPEALARWLTGRRHDWRQGLAFARLMPELARLGFVVDDTADELARPRHEFLARRFGRHHLAVTLFMTHSCNLTCSYCYQAGYMRRAPTMTVEVAARIARLIEGQARVLQPKSINVTLFGGEALVAAAACARVVVDLRDMERRLGIPVEIHTCSNGSLITSLADSPVTKLQDGFGITLDGPRRTHDAVRKERSGAGSYDRIMSGIKLLCSRGLHLGVRIHTNDLDGPGLLEVLDDLAATGIGATQEPTIFLASHTAGGCDSLSACNRSCIDQWVDEDTARIAALVPFLQGHPLEPWVQVYGHQHGGHPLQPSAGSCISCTQSGLSIDSDGAVFHCPSFTTEADIAGRIVEQGRVTWNAERLRMLLWRWWRDGPCASCEYLALCGASCPRETIPSLEACPLRRLHHNRIERYLKDNPAAEARRGAVPVH